MRTSILVWSTFSGVVLGIFVDAVLIGLMLLLGAVMPTVIPNVTERLTQRWTAVASVVVLTVIPAALAVLGFLEGRLKAT